MNGVLFDKAQAKLLQFPGGLGGSYTIPNSIIGDPGKPTHAHPRLRHDVRMCSVSRIQ